MKFKISKKPTENKNLKNLTIETTEMLDKYLEKYDLGYIVRHFVLSDCVIHQIANENCCEKCDDMFTLNELTIFRQQLISSIVEINEKTNQ